MGPKVSFVIPCYKLGHLLADCVNSILAQSYGDFEVVIMDDCSPDQTPEVAKSFRDARVKYVRNEKNLGHVPNYNKGVALARGEYVWLISADDLLRRPYILEKYVTLMEQHPGVGYVFCAAVGLLHGKETEVQKWAYQGKSDQILEGRRFLLKLLERNLVVAPTVMVRRECYERLGMFPVDMPYAGDWYYWCLLALHYDVAYYSEPMVCYRQHDLSMTENLRRTDRPTMRSDLLAVLWRMRQQCENVGSRVLVQTCEQLIVDGYTSNMLEAMRDGSGQGMMQTEFLESLRSHARTPEEEVDFRARVYSWLADHCYWKGMLTEAREMYRRSLASDPLVPAVLVKYALLQCGNAGVRARERFLQFRRKLAAIRVPLVRPGRVQ